MSDKTSEVLLPSMGEGINEATVTKWLKKPGERIDKDEPLVEVSTDKVDTEIPSPASGFLVETMAGEDETIEVNSVIALISADQNAATDRSTRPRKKASPKKSPTQPSPQSRAEGATADPTPQAPRLSPTGEVRSSPLVRKMARELGLDLSKVAGSGLGGRITKDDVEAFLRRNGRPSYFGQSPEKHLEAPQERLQTHWVDGQECLEGVAIRRESMSKMRRLIAEHMVRSVRVSPHVTTVFEVDFSKVFALRQKHKDAFAKQHGFKLTYTPFFIHAATQAIKEHPIVNTSLDGEELLWKDRINIGCAVALDGGLIVPVIKDAQDQSLPKIAASLNDLVTRARSKSLKPEDVQGGTFSITNPGGFGSLTSNPIINQPQVAILGIGSITERPVAENGKVVIKPQVWVSLTFDHRVVDGEGGARYLATLRDFLQGYGDSALD